MPTGDTPLPGDMDVRDREVVPGVFVPFPDSKQGVKEDARKRLQELSAEPNNEPDATCEESLSEGLDEETVNNYRGVRQWVMCRAWQKHKDENVPFAEAVGSAWSEAEQAGA